MRTTKLTTRFTLLTIPTLLLIVGFTNPTGNFPLNDDWQYAYPVKSWIETGHLEFQGVFAPNILLQVAWGFLFCKIASGFDFTWLRFSTLVLALIAVFSFYKMAKSARPEHPFSVAFAALVLVLNPLFYSLSFSFMSDVPFLALCLLSIFSFYRYLEKGHLKWIIFAAGFAVGSFYIRQPGILLLPAFAIFILVKNHFTKNSLPLAATLLLLSGATYLSFEYWVKPALSISGNYVPVGEKYYEALFQQPLLTMLEWVKKFIKTYVYLGFFGLPFLPFLWGKIKASNLLAHKIWLPALILNGLLLLYLIKIGKTFPFGGNVLYNLGLGPDLLADVYTLGLPNTSRLPEWVMLTFNFVGQLSATLLILLIIKGFPSLLKIQKQFTWFLILLNAMYLPLMSITSFFDRYLLLPLASFFFVLVLFLQDETIRQARLKWLPFFIFGLFSVLATKDYLSWNRARHEAYNYLISQGISIEEMDAGYEYNGFYNYHQNRKEEEGRSFWWVTDDEWMIAFGAVPGYSQIASFPYRRWLFFKKDDILVLKKQPSE